MEPKFQQRIPQKAETDRPNLTGIPTQMKLDFEQRSGMSFDDVRVHYGSDRPAQLQALAYTQGRHVYIGPGQERHLGHELGHIVQQKLGQVAPTGRVGGLPINDDRKLEAEADRLAGLADRRAPGLEPPVQRAAADPRGEQGVVQMVHPAFLDQTYQNNVNTNPNAHILNINAQIAKGNRRAHSDILRASLIDDSHIPDPTRYVKNQAHHIVETNNNPLGQQILQNAGIDPDSAVNGVLLPQANSDEGGDASIHDGPHNPMYGICVTVALWNAVANARGNLRIATVRGYRRVISQNSINANINVNDAPTIINVLAQIRQMLLEDNMPLNNGADGTVGQGDTTEEQIWTAFHNRGLV